GHPVERVYIMYFLESLLEQGDKWHLHFHIVPRFAALRSAMTNKCDVLGTVNTDVEAYLIAKLRDNHPTFPLPRAFSRAWLTMTCGDRTSRLNLRRCPTSTNISTMLIDTQRTTRARFAS